MRSYPLPFQSLYIKQINYNNCFPLQISPLKIHITPNRKQFPSDTLFPKSHTRGKARSPSRVSLGSSFCRWGIAMRMSVSFLFFLFKPSDIAVFALWHLPLSGISREIFHLRTTPCWIKIAQTRCRERVML
ncbi:uncharacterized protein TM35_000153190 [Trypanosoma theileri]|uniref:Uncharacterized protein n=1 Tax=Trypanosoma theileri TaxID=67003 RepID=A0A1X0NWG8_9TRYP|nr:uncharacterized protein TM35_000153190 [Trypanosoma theileri]ORC88888.1 hypothetical protein TM35_000153190 [Trypanosoma theileri]